jgi:hypothetical protein
VSQPTHNVGPLAWFDGRPSSKGGSVDDRQTPRTGKEISMATRLGLALLLLFSASVARADDDDGGSLRLAMKVAVVPQATLRSGTEPDISQTAPRRALAAGLSLDYACGDVLFVGVGSQYVYWVHQALSDGPAEGSEADLYARIGANGRVTESWRMFAYLSPGYSVLVPSSGSSALSEPRGLVVAGTVGTSVDLLPALFFTVELGYQEGFQTAQDDGIAIDHQTRFMQVGLGLGLRLL